ncbi:MAG: methyltransferase domain-containing protein [Dokdonella sp.]
MSSSSDDDYLDQVKAEIRAEADAARGSSPSTPRLATTAADPVAAQDDIEPKRRDFAIGELTGAHYSAFVEQAFRAVLQREPDEAGWARQVHLLAAGASKAEVLGNLRWSPEGRRLRVRVRGLLPRYLLAKLAHVPLLGYVIEWAMAFAALPLLLRHQRAADTQVAARFDAAAGAQRDQGQRLDSLDSGLMELGAERDRRNADAAAQREHGRRLDELTARVGEFGADHDRRSRVLQEAIRRMLLRLDDLQHRAETLHNRADAAQSHIDMLRERSDALEGRAAALEGRAAPLEMRTAAVEARASTVESSATELQRRAADLEGRSTDLESRSTALEGFHSTLADRTSVTEARTNDMIELRHYVHAVNHWIASMQSSLANLDEAAAAERKQVDALAAAVGLGAEETAEQVMRHTQWATRLGAELPSDARVLDIGSGDGAWLEMLAAHTATASGVEANHALVARAQARGITVALGDAQATLGRCADASLDAVTLSAAVLAGDDVPVARVLAHIMRALSPGGRVLLRVEDEPYRLDLTTGAPTMHIDPARWAAVLTAAGFSDSQLLPAPGATAVLAQSPAL